MAPFKGMVLTNDFDNTRDSLTENPIGIGFWSDVLYFGLFDKAQFEADEAGKPNLMPMS